MEQLLNDFDGAPPVIARERTPLQMKIGYTADHIVVNFNQLVGNLNFSEVEALGFALELLNALREKKIKAPRIVLPS